MKLAQIQIGAKAKKEDSIRLAADYIKRAAEAGADLVMLPEMFNCPYDTKNFPIYAEKQGDSCFLAMQEAARLNGVYLVAGSMPEVDDAGKVYNTSYVFGRDGELIAKHRKAHLFDIDVKGGQRFKESETLTPGDSATVFDTEFGRMGLMICYDIRFPELSRRMALDGAKVVLVPAAFNMTTGPAHWTLTFRARALDNQVFMAGCSQARGTEGYISYGHSIVTSPWGEVLSEMDETEGMVVTEIDLSVVEQIREQLPLLRQRREELY